MFIFAKRKRPTIEEIWRTAVFVTVKEIVFFRNKIVVDNGLFNPTSLKSNIINFTGDCEIIMKSNMWNDLYDLLILKFFGMKCSRVKSVRIKEIYFHLPPVNHILLCCDDASKGNSGEAGYGFISRDHTGEVVVSVAGGMGIATNFLVEVIAVLSACEWAILNQFLRIYIRTDSRAQMTAFLSDNIPWYSITRWNKIISNIQNYRFIHSNRELIYLRTVWQNGCQM